MDMESVHHASLLWLNDHSWYRIETTAEYVRAALWCLSNLMIAAACFLLPVEIRHWRLARPFKTTALVTAAAVRRERRLIVVALEGVGAALAEGEK
jgi:hypothetical protein